MVVFVAVLLLIHIIRLMLPASIDLEVIYTFGFVPARYGGGPEQLAGQFPGGVPAEFWSFFTYAFLHGDWLHVGVNIAWMAAFGTPVLRRFGTARFIALSLVATLGGALAHLWAHWGEIVPMIGASAAISGQMGAAVRFAFQHGGPIGARNGKDEWRWRIPALPLHMALRDVRVLAFVVVWFAVNYAFGATSAVAGEAASIAWEAHIGGFLVGLLLFRLFDPWHGAPPDYWTPPPPPESEELPYDYR